MTHKDAIALRFTEIAYQSDLATVFFSKIQHLPWSMLLHSAAKEHVNSRFDILVADPIATVIHQNGFNTITSNKGEKEVNQNDPLAELERVKQGLLPKLDTHEDWPFLGGALGFFSYDLGRQFEQLPEIANKNSTLPDMAVGIYDWALLIDHQKKTAVIVEPKSSNRPNWLESFKHPSVNEFALTSAWQSNMTAKSYADKFDQVKEYIVSGDCYQINLAQRFSANYQGSEWQAYQHLAKNNSTPFSAFIRINHHAVLSLSPERFLSLDGDKIETKPIKGTMPRRDCKIQDKENKSLLQNSEKDRAENVMIVDLLRNDIGRVAKSGSVKVPKLFSIESFPAVHHLVSTVTGKLSSCYTAADLLRACFPGGSITGAPKVRAMEIIEELEPHRRTIYCGSIGYISRCGRMDTNISIRTLLCEENQIHAWAGGGLVMDSQVNAEYQETLDKVNKILPLLTKLSEE